MPPIPIIRDIRARAVKVPFARSPMSAPGSLPDAALVLIDVATNAGITGRAYMFTFMAGMLPRRLSRLQPLLQACQPENCIALRKVVVNRTFVGVVWILERLPIRAMMVGGHFLQCTKGSLVQAAACT